MSEINSERVPAGVNTFLHRVEGQARVPFSLHDTGGGLFVFPSRFYTVLLLLKLTKELIYKSLPSNLTGFLNSVNLCVLVYLVHYHCFCKDKAFFLKSTIIESWLNYSQSQ